MANALTRNPVEIDTAFASYKAATASTLGVLTTLRIAKIRWVGPAAAGQQVEFIDPAGGNQLSILTSGSASTDVEQSFDASPRIWADFGVPQVPSGKILVFLK